MKRRFQLEDPNGRYMTAEYDKDTGMLMTTTYLNAEPNISIEETLEEAGFTITSKTRVEKPQVINLNQERKSQ